MISIPSTPPPYLATGVTSTESGLSRVMGQLREYLDDDEDGAYDRIVHTRTLNGRTYTLEEYTYGACCHHYPGDALCRALSSSIPCYAACLPTLDDIRDLLVISLHASCRHFRNRVPAIGSYFPIRARKGDRTRRTPVNTTIQDCGPRYLARVSTL